MFTCSWVRLVRIREKLRYVPDNIAKENRAGYTRKRAGIWRLKPRVQRTKGAGTCVSVLSCVFHRKHTSPAPSATAPPPLRSRKMSYHLLCQNSQKQPKSAFSAEYKLYRAERTLAGVVVHYCMRSGCTTNASLLR